MGLACCSMKLLGELHLADCRFRACGRLGVEQLMAGSSFPPKADKACLVDILV
jgi:hypothetical protein